MGADGNTKVKLKPEEKDWLNSRGSFSYSLTVTTSSTKSQDSLETEQASFSLQAARQQHVMIEPWTERNTTFDSFENHTTDRPAHEFVCHREAKMPGP